MLAGVSALRAGLPLNFRVYPRPGLPLGRPAMIPLALIRAADAARPARASLIKALIRNQLAQQSAAATYRSFAHHRKRAA